MSSKAQPRIAVLLPCYNEEAAIAATVAGFKAALPGAAIYVYDNNSRDRTVEIARQAGAIVRPPGLRVAPTSVPVKWLPAGRNGDDGWCERERDSRE